MRYILVGGSGYLGSYITNQLLNENSKITVTYRGKKPSWDWVKNKKIEYLNVDFDITDSVDSLCDYINNCGGKISVIYLAAYHHPDKVEENKCYAWDININKLAYIINKLPDEINFIYASTDNVFSSGNHFFKFKEDDHCSPINEYGRQKRLAENIVLTRGFNVVRCPFLIGESLINRPHFCDVIIDSLKSNTKFELFSDSHRSALHFRQVAKIIIQLSNKYYAQNYGVVHIASDYAYSKYDVGVKIADKYGFKKELLSKISFDEASIFKAKREKNILLDNTKIKSMLCMSELNLEL